MYQHILVPTDLSDMAPITVTRAKSLADKFGAKLSLLHVIEPIPAYGYPGFTEIESPYIDHAKKELANLAKEFGVAAEDQHIAFGPTKTCVIHSAKELGVDLIIVGSHGRHGITRILGSTASAILHSADCDVLTVRSVKD